jgi:hypothetical protein
MSSLGDIQQIYTMLQEVDRLLSKIDAHADSTTEKTKTLQHSFNQLEQVALRYLLIARRLGLPDDAQRALDLLARTIIMLRQAQIAVNLLVTASGPLGWAMALASVGMVAVSGADYLSMASETR